MANGVDKDKILRTDRGDSETRNKKAGDHGNEWAYGGLKDCEDKSGDDDVEVRLPDDPAAQPLVRYRQRKTGC